MRASRTVPPRGLRVPGIFLFMAAALLFFCAPALPQTPKFGSTRASVPFATRPSKPRQPQPRAMCPLLPGCPNGPSVPLPPGAGSPGFTWRKPTVTVERAEVREGTGRYSGMVLIPAGPFLMGSPDNMGRPDEHPRHKVHIKQFYISRTEVTAREYCRFLNAQGLLGRDGVPRVNLSDPTCPIMVDGRVFKPKKGMAFRPMTCVSWYGAKDYAHWLGGRLPTAAEWEKAALLTNPNPPGDYLTILPRTSSVPVSLAIPGIKGVSGMIGNVWEWCSDWYARDYYSSSRRKNPQGPSLGKLKEIRGGSWASPEACRRITNRHKAAPQGYFRTVGFRIVMD